MIGNKNENYIFIRYVVVISKQLSRGI